MDKIDIWDFPVSTRGNVAIIFSEPRVRNEQTPFDFAQDKLSHVACVEQSFVLELFVSEPVLSEVEGFQDKKKKNIIEKRDFGFIQVAP
ncbi:MAG: hypothetical protein ACXVPY_14190, partial [Bacteroidia bacterium]